MRQRQRLARLGSAEFTYSDVGATLGPLPAGYRHVECRRIVGRGAADFRAAAAALMQWEMHRRAGLTVVAEADAVGPDVNAILGVGVGRLRVSAPVRVVYLVDDPDRRGFAYGTLPGHPESGEESFILERLTDDRVELEIRAFSRPGTWWSRLGGPVNHVVQERVTARYLRALSD